MSYTDPSNQPPQQWGQQQYQQPGGQGFIPQQGQQPVVVLKNKPNHVLHLILTLLTCGSWSSVWIVLTARYWGVGDYRDPAAKPGMNRRTWIAVGVQVGISLIGGLILAIAAAGTTKAISDATANGVKPFSSPVASPVKAKAPKAESPSGPATTIPGEGTFVVGADIKAGSYVTKGGETCYWSRNKDTSGDIDAIISNGAATGQTTVTIKASDAAFTTSGCPKWVRR